MIIWVRISIGRTCRRSWASQSRLSKRVRNKRIHLNSIIRIGWQIHTFIMISERRETVTTWECQIKLRRSIKHSSIRHKMNSQEWLTKSRNTETITCQNHSTCICISFPTGRVIKSKNGCHQKVSIIIADLTHHTLSRLGTQATVKKRCINTLSTVNQFGKSARMRTLLVMILMR